MKITICCTNSDCTHNESNNACDIPHTLTINCSGKCSDYDPKDNTFMTQLEHI